MRLQNAKAAKPRRGRITPEPELLPDELLAMLQPPAHEARRAGLTYSGPPLSMNVELADGQELPAALHTLLQGTLWAVLMAAGADPDLEDTRLWDKGLSQAPAYLKPKTLTLEQSMTVYITCTMAQASSTSTTDTAGRLFELAWSRYRVHPRYTRLDIPPVVSMYTHNGSSIVIVTSGGLFGLEYSQGSGISQLGFQSGRVREVEAAKPRRIQLPETVAAFEASLPRRRKDLLVTGVERRVHAHGGSRRGGGAQPWPCRRPSKPRTIPRGREK
ncbi:hypothetical protein J8273_2626 [Carpediemonas membranifera]|uniref:Uncharacterized protein n=1 Tax=Carpediemonas membranifera TaxID=201153 RepID=A0A8J6B782_9EUKA|nr:hypothetical protein J8273_2626 [Carpediemonas membranifera]|eukprot:KAG9395719.1 hypothetical protein J8273_2626 [Carpediemonas membranifera]